MELAPAPDLSPDLRDKLLEAAMRLARRRSTRTSARSSFWSMPNSGEFFFIEANPRLQVEHTVTEEVTGLNLVEVQLQIAGGQTLADLGLTRDMVPSPRGMAMQLRVNTETMQADGEARPGGGVLTAFEPPSGRGIRVDHYGYVGYRTNPAYDSLLAKLIVHTSSTKLTDVLAKGYRALCEFHIAGAPTNVPFLQNLCATLAWLMARRTPAMLRSTRRPWSKALTRITRTSISRQRRKAEPGEPVPRLIMWTRWPFWLSVKRMIGRAWQAQAGPTNNWRRA